MANLRTLRANGGWAAIARERTIAESDLSLFV
jgi:hypothetical protein